MPVTTSNATQRERDRIPFDKVPGTRAQAHGSVAKKRALARKETTLPIRFVPRFWEDSDTRFHAIRVIRKRYRELKADTGAESYQRDLLCQREAFLSVVLETMEEKACEGAAIDWGGYSSLLLHYCLVPAESVGRRQLLVYNCM
jgi:hypothetical protein